MDLKKINDSRRVKDSDEGQQFLAQLIFQGHGVDPKTKKEYTLKHSNGVTIVSSEDQDEEYKIESELFEDNIQKLAEHFDVKLG